MTDFGLKLRKAMLTKGLGCSHGAIFYCSHCGLMKNVIYKKENKNERSLMVRRVERNGIRRST